MKGKNESKKMIGKEIAFFEKKGAKGLAKHERSELREAKRGMFKTKGSKGKVR